MSSDALLRELRERLEAQDRRQAELLEELRRARGVAPAPNGGRAMNDAIRRAAGRQVAEEEEAS